MTTKTQTRARRHGGWFQIGRGVSLLLTLAACGRSSGCSGCSADGPPFPEKDKIQSAVQVRLTDNGIGFKGSQRLRQQSGLKRESKGLEVLRRKIDTLNRLYGLDLALDIRDLSDSEPGGQGTRVTLTYSPDKIWTTLKK